MPAGTAMTTEAALVRLMTWLSPAYPVGAFSYSHGLEWAVEEGPVHNRASLVAWLEPLLRHGGPWTDAVLLARGHDAITASDPATWSELRELAGALPATAELRLETMAQGEAFARTSLACWPDVSGRLSTLLMPDEELAYPLAVAAVAACHGIPLAATLAAYLQAVAGNLVSAAVRLVPVGQTDGQRAMAALAGTIGEVAHEAATTPLDELGSCALMVDWCSMRHETQYTRLFRS